jgi:hypothetical protein
MKRILSVSIILLFLFSCSKTKEPNQDILKVDTSHCPATLKTIDCTGLLCQSDTCSTYFAIWKSQFLTKNQMSNDYFTNHITPCQSKLVNWVDGISYEIYYKVKVDWAEVVLTDRFAIWLSNTTLGLYPTISLTRNSLLTNDQILSLFSIQAFNSYLNTVSSPGKLKYSSLNDAMEALIKASKVDTLCTGDVFYQYPNLLAPPIGNPCIEASGALNWNENKCITSLLDLVTGEASVFYNVCVNTDI